MPITWSHSLQEDPTELCIFVTTSFFRSPIRPMRINHAHLPSWLADNAFFRNLFLFRKIFLTKRFSTHYGQSAEDLLLGRLFPKRYKGFFVDVGCFHPVKYNNTYALYKEGWRGVNIDIQAIKIKGFNWIRPGDTNIAMAASDREGEVTFWSNGLYTPTVTLEKSFADERTGTRYQYRPQTVQAKPLTSILDGTRFKDRGIDLLSIDVEGHDLQVLKGLDFDRYRPDVVAVEFDAPDLDHVLENDLHQFLAQKGYNLINWVGLTQIYRDTLRRTQKGAH